MNFTESIMSWINKLQIANHFPRVGIEDFIEILILTFVFYYIAKNLKGTRAWILLKGVIILFCFYALAYLLNFDVIVVIFQSLMLFFGIAVIVIIQPDLRKLIEKIGTKNINITFKSILDTIFKDRTKNNVQTLRVSDLTIQELVKGCALMGKAKTGALIVIEGDIPLNDCVESGIKVNADITSQLLLNIFEKNTPLHDGAIVVQNDKITAATCYLPLSDSKNINKDLGTRHRAGIGISETTDAFVIIVSEETGAISIAKNGKLLHNLDREKLAEELKKIQKVKTVEPKKHTTMLERNLLLKLGCLIGSLFLWMVIVTNINPIETTTLKSVDVELINTELITETGKTFEILTGETVNVTIRDRKDIIDNVEPADVRVVADFSKLSIVNAIELQVIADDYPDSEIYLSNSTMTISIEDIISTEIDIEVVQTGKINENYYISSIDLDQDTLVVSGAKSVINTIGSVKVEIDTSKLRSNSELQLTPKVYDKNGDQLSGAKLTLNYSTIGAKVNLYNTKVVPLEVKTTLSSMILRGIIKDIEYSTSEIRIAAPDEVLDQYEKVTVLIPLEVSLADIQNEQFIRSVQLGEYLPDGLVVTDEYERINVILNFIDFYTKSLTFKSTDTLVKLENINEKLEYSLVDKDISINILGINELIEQATLETLEPYIDVKGLKAGEHEVKIQFKSFSGNIFGDLMTKINISDRE